MTGPHDTPSLDDVIEPEGNPTRDRTQHAKDPHPSDEMEAYAVSRRVNRPANNEPSVMEPAA